MFCPKNHFLISEISEMCGEHTWEIAENMPDWLQAFQPVNEAVPYTLDRLRAAVPGILCRWYPDEARVKQSRDWQEVFLDAFHNWLLFRFLEQGRRNICIALPSGQSVRLAGHVSHFTVGHTFQGIRESSSFPRDQFGVVALAIAGQPYNRVARAPDYTLRFAEPSAETGNIFDLELRLLSQFRGLPLTWDGDGNQRPQDIIKKIAVKGLSETGPAERQESQRKVPIHRAILQHVGDGLTKVEIRELFPDLSVRRFDAFWRQASEIQSDISRPGRKSRH